MNNPTKGNAPIQAALPSRQDSAGDLRGHQNTKRQALVLGATGGIGGELTRGLLARGWAVRALRRASSASSPGVPPAWHAQVDWRVGDALAAADVAEAARGVDLIVHGVNPPGYRRWAEVVLPMLDNSIAAAVREQARIVLPGTVYNYAPGDLQPGHPEGSLRIDESAPQRARTRKGAIRVAMEARLEDAATRGARVLVLRAGDYFGAASASSWFSNLLVQPGRPVARILQPGTTGVGHQWAYLPDVAETVLQLLDREARLAPFARFHMDGHWDADGSQMLAAIQRALGGAPRSEWRLPWWLVRALAPLVPLCREMAELRYLWNTPLRLDNARLVAELGAEPHTPLDAAVLATLAGLGCLPPRGMVGTCLAAGRADVAR